MPPAAAASHLIWHAVAVCELGQVLDMTAEQCLVRGNHVLAVRERVFENFGRGMLAANELDYDVDSGVARTHLASWW